MVREMIYIGSDHAGFKLKEKIIKYFKKKKISYEDLGNCVFKENDDYPDFIIPVAKKVSKDGKSKGIVIGGSGQGEAIAANKIKGIRCALYYGGSLKIIKLSREHNDSNVLSFGARFVSERKAKRALELWLNTKFSGVRKHKRRNDKLGKIGSR